MTTPYRDRERDLLVARKIRDCDALLLHSDFVILDSILVRLRHGCRLGRTLGTRLDTLERTYLPRDKHEHDGMQV